jgi:hypothetical protein
MKEKIEKYMGKSWRTTLCGVLGVAVFTIHENPGLIEFLPDQLEASVLSVSKLLAAILIALGFSFSKDYNVTGSKIDEVFKDKEDIPKAEPVEELVVNSLAQKTKLPPKRRKRTVNKKKV